MSRFKTSDDKCGLFDHCIEYLAYLICQGFPFETYYSDVSAILMFATRWLNKAQNKKIKICKNQYR